MRHAVLQVAYIVQANVNDSVVDCSIPAAAGRMGLCVNALLLLLDDTRLPWLNSTLTDVVRSSGCSSVQTWASSFLGASSRFCALLGVVSS